MKRGIVILVVISMLLVDCIFVEAQNSAPNGLEDITNHTCKVITKKSRPKWTA